MKLFNSIVFVLTHCTSFLVSRLIQFVTDPPLPAVALTHPSSRSPYEQSIKVCDLCA